MNIGIYFIIAIVLSFLGSIPIGLITLNITQRTIQNGRRSGIMIALGATVMEFVYTYVALRSLDIFTINTNIGDGIKVISTIVFLGLGSYFLWKKSKVTLTNTSKYNYFDFLRGVIIGSLNVLIVPFWIFIAIWLKTYNISFENQADIISFSVGSALGALLAFFGYVWLSQYIAKKFELVNRYTNKVIGIIFIGLGLFQIATMLFS